MRIAIYYYIDFSGAKRLVFEQAKGLKKLGYEIDIYTTDCAEDIFSPSRYADNKFFYNFSPKTIFIPFIKRIKNDFIDTFFTLKKLHKKIAKDIDEKKYDLVLVHTDIRTQAPYLLRFLKTKNAYYCLEPLRNAHEYSLRLKDRVGVLKKTYENLNRWIRKKVDIKNTRSAYKTLAISSFARERMIAAYDLYPKVVYPGIDEKIFIPKKIGKKNQVLFVAGKYPIYGYDFAKEALRLIPVKIRPILKVISWKKNNSERLTDKELVDIYNQSKVVLSLSKFDTFGLVAIESMACRVPVVAFNVAGYRETVKNGISGFLVDFSAKKIAECIVSLLNDPKKAEEMGINGRSIVEKEWTWEKRIKDLDKTLKEIKNG